MGHIFRIIRHHRSTNPCPLLPFNASCLLSASLLTCYPFRSIHPLPRPFIDLGPLQRKAAEKAEKAPKAARGKKDKNAPKRALSAYMFFSQDWRERIKAENPDAGFGEVGKLLGAKWKELDDDEKKVCRSFYSYVLC